MRISGKLLLAAALATVGACALNSAPAEARVGISIYANVPPPPMRSEPMPPPRVGFVWIPGDWRWSHGRYNWHRGSWVRERRGYHYAPSRWDRDGDRYRYRGGRWER